MIIYIYFILKYIINNINNSFNDMKFRDVVKFGFYELQNIRNKYINPHVDIYKLYLQTELTSLYPIIPQWSKYLSKFIYYLYHGLTLFTFKL